MAIIRTHLNKLFTCGWRLSLASFLLILTVSGCGFQLEGSGRLPVSVAATYLDTQKPYTEFYDSLRDALEARGAELVDSRQEAGAILRILDDSSGQRILSVSARNTPREYEIFYTVTFSLEAEGTSLIETESLVVTRSYTYDDTQVLGKSAEEQILRQSLAQDLARQVLRLIEIGRTTVPSSQS
ncbi:MAG: LPS assembly lipoprotein LptE [Pseudomonadota bacterium]|jgi:LPS-assembly lipoprotein|nr:LPS assembly lipoprotein LptE [Pseudomonadota bacterium]